MKYIYILILFTLCGVYAIAQKGVDVICSEEFYTYPSHISKMEAENIVVNRARIKGLAEKYGTIIEVATNTKINNKQEGDYALSSVNTETIGYSEVKGEWLGDVGEPKYTYYTDEKTGQQTIKAKVCFKAREIIKSKTNIDYHLLRNGKDERFESLSFKNLDEVYLKFRTPKNGYIAVYLFDHDENVFCLVPEASISSGQQFVEHDKDYLFLEGLVLTASTEIEYNTIYIIYSPNTFTKANGMIYDGLQVVDYSLFNKWLTKSQVMDKDMQVEKIEVEIRR